MSRGVEGCRVGRVGMGCRGVELVSSWCRGLVSRCRGQGSDRSRRVRCPLCVSDPAPARSNLALCHSRFGQPGCRFRPPLVSIGGGRRCPGIDLPLLCVITHSRSLVCHYPIPIIGDWVRIFIQRRSQQRVCDRSCVHCPDSSPGTAAVDPPPNHADPAVGA